MITVAQAAADPRLLGGTALWPVQRELVTAVDGSERLFVWRIGRRGGKSYAAALVAAYNAVLREDLASCVRAGETRYVVLLGRKESQAAILLRMVEQIIRASPAFAGLIDEVNSDRIILTNGVTVLATASADSARGLPISALIFTEAAHFAGERDDPDDAGERSAVNAWNALSPALAQFGEHALTIVESTPRGRRGFFYEICTRAEAGELEASRAFHYTSAEANPTLDPAWLAAQEADDPSNFAREYLAEWSDGPTAFIEMDRWAPAPNAVIDPDHLAQPVVLGCDAAESGGMGVVVVGRDPSEQRRLVVAHVDSLRVKRGSSLLDHAARLTRQLEIVVEVAKRYDAEVVLDQYAAKQVRGTLAEKGARCKVLPQGAASTDANYREIRHRLYSGDLIVPDDPALLGDLRRLRSRTTSTGASSVVNPRIKGAHGDRASALSLAVQRQMEAGATVAHTGRVLAGEDLAERRGYAVTIAPIPEAF
jgi:hypothetical protein